MSHYVRNELGAPGRVPRPYSALGPKPDWLPVSLQRAKDDLGAHGLDRDVEILAALKAATDMVEAMYSRVLRVPDETIVLQNYPTWPSGEVRADYVPSTGVTLVDYQPFDDPTGPRVAVDPADYYFVLAEDGRSFMRFRDGYTFPSIASQGDAVQITFSLGYATAEQIEQRYLQQILTELRRTFGDLDDKAFMAAERVSQDLRAINATGNYR